MSCKNIMQRKLILVGSIGFIGTFLLNLLVQYSYPSGKSMFFHPQWQESIWILIYLVFLTVVVIGVLCSIFGKRLEKNVINKKASYLRLVVAIPVFLFGAFLSIFSVFDFGLDRIASLIFGLLYMYSSYLIFIPLRNKVSLPAHITNKCLVSISVCLCLIVFVLPAINYLTPVKSEHFDKFIFSSYENGFIYSLFAIVFAVGINLRLERGSGHKVIFIVLGLSLAAVLIILASMVIYVIAHLA